MKMHDGPRSIALTAVAGLLLTAAAAAHAVPVVPFDGAPLQLSGITSILQPQLAGRIVEDSSTPFSYRVMLDRGESAHSVVQMQGSLQSRVVKAVDGSYDFYWRVSTRPITTELYVTSDEAHGEVRPLPPGFSVDLSNVTLSGFTVPRFRAGWRSDMGSGAAPRTAVATNGRLDFRFAEFTPPEEYPVVGNSTLTSGGNSAFFFVDTDAHAYRSGASMDLNTLTQRGNFEGEWGCSSCNELNSGAIRTFAPAPVPEPATWALMLLGLGTIVGVTRHRARQNASAG